MFFTSENGSAAERMRISSAGNVGINVSGLNARFQVKVEGTDGLPVTTAETGTLSIGSASSTAVASLLGRQTSNTTGLYIMAATSNGNTVGDMVFNVRENNNTTFSTLTRTAFLFSNFGTGLVRILRNGNVGINTSGTTSSTLAQLTINQDSFSDTEGIFVQSGNNASDGGVAIFKSASKIGTISALGSASSLTFMTNGGSEKMRINSAGEAIFRGNVAINMTTAPTEALHVTGNIFVSGKYGNLTATTQGVQFEAPTTATQTCRFDSDELRFFAGGGSGVGEIFTIDETGPCTFINTVTATNFILSSDERLKENIKTLEPKVISAEWKSFNAKNNDSYRTGVIAQELEVKHPEFVETNDKGFKSVKYIDLLISKIAELEARLEKAGI
jgi:hypothetical protein